MKIGKYELLVKRSRRKTLGIKITRELEIEVTAPFNLPDSEIERIVISKSNWIDEHLSKMKNKLDGQSHIEKFTYEEIKELADKALDYIPKRVKYYAYREGFSYNRITIRNQVSRWGSCSSKCNLNFNCLLMLTPDYVIDYVVVHELCHLREMNHSPAFWAEVKKILPDYEKALLWLKENGDNIISRMRNA